MIDPHDTEPAHLPTAPTRQFSFNVIVPIEPARLPALVQTLERVRAHTQAGMRGAWADDATIRFDRMSALHFARWFVLDDAKEPRLALATWFDGPEGEDCSEPDALALHLDELWRHGGAGLREIYAHCRGYPGDDEVELRRWLLSREYVHETGALHVGSRGRSRRQIVAEARLRTRARAWIDARIAGGDLPTEPSRIRSALLAHVGEVAPFPAQPRLGWKVWLAGGLAGALVLGLAPLALLALAALRSKERTDPQFQPIFSAAERARVAAGSVGENLFFQNGLSNVVDVKPGRFRRTVLRLVLFALDFLGRTRFVHGKLGGIASIHAAHWYLVDGGRRLIFVSNFDSSWESYLGDFIDQESSGLTAVWSNTVGYPVAEWLHRNGSRDADRFKAWARHIQVATQVWYSAYPGLSVLDVNHATELRRGLADESAVPAATWLARLQ